MVEADVPPALRSPWAFFVLLNRIKAISGVDVARRWADDMMAFGMMSDAVVSLAILRDDEWQETPALVDAVLRELAIDPADTLNLLRFVRPQIVLAIEGGADPREQVRTGTLLASELYDVPGYDGAFDIFYWIDDELDLVASRITSNPSLERLGAKNWILKQLHEQD